GSPRHDFDLARRLDSSNTTFTLSKRFADARWTFYDPGLGACGKTNGANDFIVALNIGQWAGGSHCFQAITMSYGGKTATATIVDQCPGCPYAGLDLSPALFSYFASQDLGVIQGSWNF
ncbi:RlpA-like double-psi beta-barrel-protein domain-containing protein-containing protein, partial [Vararia minispora EC-137]